MIYFNSTFINNPFLHDAVLVTQLLGYKFHSLYIDPLGECAVKYKGELSERDVATILQQFYIEDISIHDIHPERYKDWEVDYIKHTDKVGFTTIYTPDGVNYKKIYSKRK